MSATRTPHPTGTRITHVIFDVDGLLLDTEKIYSECCEEISAEFGKKFTWDIKVKQMGKKEKEAAQVHIDELHLPLTLDEYTTKMRGKLSEKFKFTQVMPGAEKLVRHLHSHNVPIATATGSDEWSYTQKTASHKELFSLFHHCVICGDDPEVKFGKPAPDCFQVCAKRFGEKLKPEEVLVFEDAPNGVQAGLAAGMKVVWVPDPRNDRLALKGHVEQIIDSLEQFKPEYFGLPPFNS